MHDLCFTLYFLLYPIPLSHCTKNTASLRYCCQCMILSCNGIANNFTTAWLNVWGVLVMTSVPAGRWQTHPAIHWCKEGSYVGNGFLFTVGNGENGLHAWAGSIFIGWDGPHFRRLECSAIRRACMGSPHMNWTHQQYLLHEVTHYYISTWALHRQGFTAICTPAKVSFEMLKLGCYFNRLRTGAPFSFAQGSCHMKL